MSYKYANRSTYSDGALVTGATGLLGRWLVPELLLRGQHVHALVRGGEARRGELEADLRRRGAPTDRLHLLAGDLDAEGLGLGGSDLAGLTAVDRIFHLGASFAWGLTPEAAERTNVAGTRRVVALARQLPARPRLVLVGGYRLVPRRTPAGRLVSASPRELARAGAYEASKHRAHHAALEACAEGGVPHTSVHPCSVIGDARSGETTQVTGLGESILALAHGSLPVRGFDRGTFVPLISVDFVARFLAEVAGRDDTLGGSYPLLDPATPLLDALIDRAAQRLGVAAPRLRLPTWFVRSLPERITRTSREALAFLDDATYPAAETDALLARMKLVRPDIGSAFDRWVDYLASRTIRSPAPARC
jgi:dihydroflavonol-4-reductase